MCALVHRGPPLLQWRTQALRRLLWQGSWRRNTGRRSGTTGTSRIGPYRLPLLPLCFHPSACLVIDGKVVAFAEEERFSRRKHHKGARSCAVAAAYCLSEGGITLADVDEIAIASNPAWPTPSNICTDAELIAEHLGLGNWTSSGKLMGLAGYGNPDRYTLDFLTARAGGSSRRS